MRDTPQEDSAHWLNRTVAGAGLTSGLGDVTHEAATAILPGFLAVLGIPAAALGTIEGVADALSSFSKLGSGYVADRLGHRKSLVVAGYGLTTAMLLFFAMGTGWAVILMGRIVGWLGRGIRGPLRDAIMAEAVSPATRGRAFGFHRAADTVGAILGPLAGVALLAWAHDAYVGDASLPFRIVFWLMLIPGIASVLSFMMLVKDPGSMPNPELRFWTTVRNLPIDFRRYLVAVGAFGLGDFAPTLLILGATQLLTPRLGIVHAAQVAGLLYVGRNAVQAVASFPIGTLADRIGHRRVLVGGYVTGVVAAALMATAFALTLDGYAILALIFFLSGLCVAVEEALESVLTASLVRQEVRGIGYGILGTVNGAGDLVSSVVVGLLWTAVSPVLGFGLAASAMGLGTVAMARVARAHG